MPVARQWTLTIDGSAPATTDAVRRAVTSSARWTMAAESGSQLVVLHQPPRWLPLLPTAVQVHVSDDGAGRSFVELRIDSQQLVSGDIFQLYLAELQALSAAIAYEAGASTATTRPVANPVSPRETVFLVLLLVVLVGGVLLWVTNNWLCLLAFVPLIAFAAYATITKPKPPRLSADPGPYA